MVDHSACARCKLGALLSGALLFAISSQAGIIQGGSTAGLDNFDFDAVPNPAIPWTAYSVISGSGLTIGERLVGQFTTPSGVHDIVGGIPTTPLTVDASVPSIHGVSVFNGNDGSGDLDLGPEGTLGWPDPNSLGEGSFSVLFEIDQITVGFDIDYADRANQAQALFYDRTGAQIGSLGVTHAAWPIESPVSFTVTSGSLIAAMTVNNTDDGGLGYDNIRYVVPEPGSLALSLVGLLALRRRS